MTNFFTELKRRHIYRMAVAYAVVAWVLIQLVNNVAPALRLPEWAPTLVIVLLTVGFPVALLFCWIQHIPPATDVSPQPKTSRLDWILAGGLAAVIAIFVYQQIASLPTPPPLPQQQKGGISVAVLPFANLSGDAAQEFFSDGVTEEITAALAKVPTLRTVGRSSAFQFKGQNRDLRAIGQSLGATYLIDGSVRKAGDQVRITAQLVQADNGVSVWTDSYDRELRNIFATQSDIAQAIARALRVPLGLQSGGTPLAVDPESYDQYLRAKALVRQRDFKPLTDGAALLEQVVARSPDFAPGWAQLALAYAVMPGFHPVWNTGSTEEIRRVVGALQPKAEDAARRAIQLDANLADGYLPLGRTLEVRGKLIEAEEFYTKALALDPNNPETLHRYSLVLVEVGRIKEAVTMRQKLQELEPFAPAYSAQTAQIRWLNGETDAAIAMLKDLPSSLTLRAGILAEVYAAAGRYNDAADTLQSYPSGSAFGPGTLENAVRLLRTAPAAAASPETLPRLDFANFIFLHVGAPLRALETHEQSVEVGFIFPSFFAHVLWHPSYAPVRNSDRFKTLVRRVGLVEYWRAKGWPPQCHPTTGDDFVCN